MTFTDDDLKRLKEESESDFPRMGTPPYLKALFARLEAAEVAMLACQDDYCCNTPEYEAWRKAAGK